jgi:hypothetical protein
VTAMDDAVVVSVPVVANDADVVDDEVVVVPA